MFSIVIPTYKRDEDLAECLESIKKNTTLPYEVIVLHAGMQSTEKVCEKYGVNSVPDNARKNGKRVKSLWAIINDGIKLAKYDYVLYLNDDCLVLPEWDKIAADYFSDNNTGLLVLRTKGIDNNPEFRIGKTLYNFPCANYAIINKKSEIYFDEKYDWYYGDADIPLQFALTSSFKIKETAENMIIHNHKIDESRKEHDQNMRAVLKDQYRCTIKWAGCYRKDSKLVKKYPLRFYKQFKAIIHFYYDILIKR